MYSLRGNKPPLSLSYTRDCTKTSALVTSATEKSVQYKEQSQTALSKTESSSTFLQTHVCKNKTESGSTYLGHTYSSGPFGHVLQLCWNGQIQCVVCLHIVSRYVDYIAVSTTRTMLYGFGTFRLCHLADIHTEYVEEVVNILPDFSKSISSLFYLIGDVGDINRSPLQAA